MNDLYREVIVAHFREPKNFGKLNQPDYSKEMANSVCGDKIRIDFIIDKKTNKIKDVKFTGDGCAILIASASLLTEKIKGKNVSFLKILSKDDILKMLGIELSATRTKCALLPLEVAQSAIK